MCCYREHLDTCRDVKQVATHERDAPADSAESKIRTRFSKSIWPLISQKQLAELLGMSVRGSARFSGVKLIWPKVFVNAGLKLVGECYIALLK